MRVYNITTVSEHSPGTLEYIKYSAKIQNGLAIYVSISKNTHREQSIRAI